MSKYSGKCDLCDHFFMGDIPIEEQLKQVEIHQAPRNKLLHIRTEAELALYFPYICGVVNGNYIWIGDNDYIRVREMEHIDFIIHEVKLEKALCKRKGIEYVPENVYKKRLSWLPEENKDAYMEIIRRVGEGRRQNYKDIRLKSVEWLRRIWLEDLIGKYRYEPEFARKWVYHVE